MGIRISGIHYRMETGNGSLGPTVAMESLTRRCREWKDTALEDMNLGISEGGFGFVMDFSRAGESSRCADFFVSRAISGAKAG
ncbi:MAG: hypothetical protein H0U65_03540 [Rubrobacter sp.]|nr:hypothetical protein [Rubrobacter sp.]